MSSVTQMVQSVSDVFEMKRSFVQQVARKLLDDNLLPKSSGRAVAQVQPKDLANLILAVAVADRIVTAEDRLTTWSKISVNGKVSEPIFIEFLTDIIEDIIETQKIDIYGILDCDPLELIIEIVTNQQLAFVHFTANPALSPHEESGLLLKFANSRRLARGWVSNAPRKSISIPCTAIQVITNLVFRS
ncbi:MAG: hypothetical protein MRY72_08310 [Aquisalinus sp.]|nr:hypothetical protein [Aquisalinus sp.]